VREVSEAVPTMLRQLALLLCLSASPALATELAGSLKLGVGMGIAPDRDDSLLLSAGARAQLGATFGPGHAVFAVGRLQPLADPALDEVNLGYLVGVAYERRFALYEQWRPTLGFTLGIGGTNRCEADVCNEGGPAAAFELGVQRMLGRSVHLSLSAELLTQVNTGVIEGTLLLPTLWAGLGF
jgi:hypothetical protein